jgi:hypothetical protein
MRGLHPRRQTPHPSAMLRIASTLSHKGRGEENYTDAVVTPPSTTMVWPVMKLEASEPR